MHPGPGSALDRLRFGEFEVDLRSHELWRGGERVPLQQKAFLVLRELLRRPGDVVTRAELVAALWPEGYFVDAEHGVNTAVRRLREAVGDSAGEPRFIETLPRVGYRFIGAPMTVTPPARVAIEGPSVAAMPAVPVPSAMETTLTVAPPEVPAALRASVPTPWARRRLVAVSAALVVAALASAAISLRRPDAATAGVTPATVDAVEELLSRARYLRNVKRQAEAMQFVTQAQAIAPGNPRVLGALALGLLGEGRDDEARAMAARAVAADDGAWEAHRALGTLAVTAGDFAAAERHLRRALAGGPVDAKSHTRLARHLLQIGRFDDARATILDARRLEPDDPDVQNIWMEYALRTGDFVSAVREGEQWLAIWAAQIPGAPTPTVRDMLGLAYLGSGRYDDALAQFRAIDPGDTLRVALVHAHAGRHDEARALIAAAEAEPGGDDPGRDGAMAMVYVALGDHDRALAHLDRQRAGRMFPGWVNCRLFEGIRDAPGYAAFARRLEHDYFTGAAAGPPHGGDTTAMRSAALQYWPRPAGRARRG